ncbi:MAG TPA: acyl carrier protein [Candidatus Scatomorpha gallistercoris]|nr:acyl carrier protein [Candidatus Scatomorpha gallistercoris]
MEVVHLFETVRKVLAEQLEVDESIITPETDIIYDLGADSLDLVELVMSLEEHYDIVLTDDKTANVRTVGQVVKMLEQFI